LPIEGIPAEIRQGSPNWIDWLYEAKKRHGVVVLSKSGRISTLNMHFRGQNRPLSGKSGKKRMLGCNGRDAG
jgi:hypothetical protein